MFFTEQSADSVSYTHLSKHYQKDNALRSARRRKAAGNEQAPARERTVAVVKRQKDVGRWKPRRMKASRSQSCHREGTASFELRDATVGVAGSAGRNRVSPVSYTHLKRYAAGVNRISRGPLVRRSGGHGPGIHERCRDILEMRDISGRQDEATREDDSGDHRVTQLTRAALQFSGGH